MRVDGILITVRVEICNNNQSAKSMLEKKYKEEIEKINRNFFTCYLRQAMVSSTSPDTICIDIPDPDSNGENTRRAFEGILPFLLEHKEHIVSIHVESINKELQDYVDIGFLASEDIRVGDNSVFNNGVYKYSVILK